MMKKRPRTVYLDADLDSLLTRRKQVSGRPRCIDICRLIRKGLELEAQQDRQAVAMAEPRV